MQPESMEPEQPLAAAIEALSIAQVQEQDAVSSDLESLPEDLPDLSSNESTVNTSEFYGEDEEIIADAAAAMEQPEAKQNRSEKKSRQAMQKLGMDAEEEVSPVIFITCTVTVTVATVTIATAM